MLLRVLLHWKGAAPPPKLGWLRGFTAVSAMRKASSTVEMAWLGAFEGEIDSPLKARIALAPPTCYPNFPVLLTCRCSILVRRPR